MVMGLDSTVENLPFDSDAGYGGPGALGLIVLETDETLEPETAQVLAPDTSLYVSRIPFDQIVTPDTLARMEQALPTALALLPQAAQFSAIGYGCTSGATVIGAERIEHLVRARFPDAAVSDPVTAAMAAFTYLGARRIGLVTPYRADVSAAMRGLFEANGFEITAFGSFGVEEDSKVARISQASVLDAVTSVGAGACDAVFAACTNLRSFGVIAEAEARLDKPVLSSNSCFLWHLHRLANRPCSGPGRLFS